MLIFLPSITSVILKKNDQNYDNYIKKYIKYGGEEINSWEILSKKLVELDV